MWKTPIPYFILVAMTAIVIILLLGIGKPQASQKRYYALKSIEGLHEVKNRKALQSKLGVNPSRVPWCGYAVAYAVKKAGGKPPKTFASGAGWKKFGKPVKLSQAKKGDVVAVASRRARSGRHVGIYSHRDKGRVCLISGNSSNRVRISCYSAKSVRAVRR